MSKGKSEYIPTVKHRLCRHCGGEVSSSGRKNREGIYYCSAPGCQRAKGRDNYRRRVAANQMPDAPTECASCGAELIARKVRHGDSPLGRWCNKPRCRRHRDAVLSGKDPQIGNVTDIPMRLEFLHRALALPRVTCEECGKEDAVDGYRHRTDDMEPCEGTGTERVKLPDAQAVWPNQFGFPPGILVAEN